jgi:hypothetical protein
MGLCLARYWKRNVVEYSDWQWAQVTHKSLIVDTAKWLEKIINKDVNDYISEEAKCEIQRVIDVLNSPSSIGTSIVFPFAEFIDDSFIPDDTKIYVVTKG